MASEAASLTRRSSQTLMQEQQPEATADTDLERGITDGQSNAVEEAQDTEREKDVGLEKPQLEQQTTPTVPNGNTGDAFEEMKEQAVAAPAGAPQQQTPDPYLVTLKGREHINPHTWKPTYRWFLTGFGGILVLNATFASSGPSQLVPAIDEHFHVSSEVGTLTIALFVAGYCLGPLLWGPLSERYGRRPIFIASFIPYTGFQVGTALSPNIGALLTFRFLGGCFAAAPLTNVGGLIADLWDADRRGIALAIFSLAPFAGPALAPIVSGVLAVKNIDWRWMGWILAIFAGVCTIALIFLLPETFVPYLLHKEAKKIRKETGDDRYYTEWERRMQNMTVKQRLNATILKPFIMIVEEPMLLFQTLYISLVYGVVYLLFEALPIVFQEVHGWNALEGGLVFLALPIGGQVAVVLYIVTFNRIYMKKHHAIKPRMVPPEERLKPMMVASVTLVIAFFWFAFTAYKSVNPASPILAIVLFGFSVLWLFLSIFNYLIDAYLINAASALAINTVFRSSFGAGFPLFARQMYDRLGTPGATGLLAGLAVLFMPGPFILYKYGKKIRSWSKNALVLDT